MGALVSLLSCGLCWAGGCPGCSCRFLCLNMSCNSVNLSSNYSYPIRFMSLEQNLRYRCFLGAWILRDWNSDGGKIPSGTTIHVVEDLVHGVTIVLTSGGN